MNNYLLPQKLTAMRTFRTIGFAFLFCAGLSLVSCTNYGKKEKSGHVEVYYKDAANQELAKKAAAYLESEDKKAGNEPVKKSFQILGGNGQYTLKMVADKEKLKNVPPGTFDAMVSIISESVFDGKPVDLELTDNKFNTFETHKYKKPEPETMEANPEPGTPKTP